MIVTKYIVWWTEARQLAIFTRQNDETTKERLGRFEVIM